jgi:octanoyl-[GcvH]:protein N-octanoyltransferase
VILITRAMVKEADATNSGTRPASAAAGVEGELRLLRDGCPRNPAFGTALSAAILQRVAATELPETARLGTPGRIVTFGRRDVVSDGYPAAVAAARKADYEAVQRIAGGRAAAYNGQALNLSHAYRDLNPAAGTQKRFTAMAELVRGALAGLGIDARIGAVPGEYCPGAFSVNAGGRLKLAGIGQRMIKGGAHVGCVIVCGASEELRQVLVPVYAALGIDWDPATTGSVEDEAPGVTSADVESALLAGLGERFELHEAEIDPGTLELAAELEPRHRSPLK